MIGSLEGRVAALTVDGCLLEVGGVGYRLACSTTTRVALPSIGESCRLWTHLQVREDALLLFAFTTEGEQTMFEALLTVGGVGPKVALALCSAMSPDEFRAALVSEDVTSLAAVPGIGKKTAQRILLELKEKLALPQSNGSVGTDAIARARSALENLGYSSGEIRVALAEISEEDASVQEVVRSALKVLA